MAEHRKMNNNDRRVKRTKKALYDALLILLKDKTINEITVTELTTKADVNRATFYFYYTDLIDMLQQIQNEAFEAYKEGNERHVHTAPVKSKGKKTGAAAKKSS